MYAAEDFHSQWGQDRFVHEWLMPFEDGTFFEVGALEGLHLSNTLFFERKRNWRGILVEMQPWFFPKIRENRPRSHCVHAALGSERIDQLFLNAGDRSGLLRHMDPRDIIHLEEHYRDRTPKPTFQVVWVAVRPIMEVFAEAGLWHINYFSLDVEGAEIDILRTIDFDRVRIDLFTIEANFGKFQPLREILEPKGYVLIGTLGVDGFFVRQDVLAELAARKGAEHIARMRAALRPPPA
jgi:FkbM family methyltransferase